MRDLENALRIFILNSCKTENLKKNKMFYA